ncbi:hypothetical protein [Thermosphaera aggregans]|uniref:Uncharacterized protein n=1 Tax=Thermosphaera aggregans (strain DSM 11486 / M11TL) TaxID=633148 RepID=D5U2E0_THEAM|nr:hypothetical protein [Thermosphaera aggregans]ADG91290.1 hypothetical protein Tagg_1020 [Thermosphaera aggregans DSM 11486]
MHIIKEYASFAEIIKSIDETIASLRQQLAENLKKLEDARARAEHAKKLKELLKTLAGEDISGPGKVIDLKDAKILINPDPISELQVIEEAIERINRTILTLQNLKKALEPWSGVEVPNKITVVIKEGIPSSFILRL